MVKIKHSHNQHRFYMLPGNGTDILLDLSKRLLLSFIISMLVQTKRAPNFLHVRTALTGSSLQHVPFDAIGASIRALTFIERGEK